ISEVITEKVDLNGVNEGFSLIVPLVYRGTYTYFKDERTTEVQVEIQPVEPLSPAENNGKQPQDTNQKEKKDS
ncbi:MAG: hypothetical protein QNK27_11070, partial [Desulfuromusa sp.]|nr:hypothetical protein [Desulfuromusa sp.]